MSETKFTSGPWEVVDHEHYPSFREVRGPSFNVKAVMVATDLTFADYLQRDADLHLIAAAPDLYEALMALIEAAEDSLDHRPEFRMAISRAYSAAAKARGE